MTQTYAWNPPVATEANVPPSWVVLTDFGKAIRFSWDAIGSSADGRPLSMDFAVFGVALGNNGSDPDQWWLDERNGSYEIEFADWEKAFEEISGTLKWDGCINWHTNPSCMMHGCGPVHCREIAAIFDTVYHVGKRQMDLLDDPVPDMPANVIEVAG